MEKALDINVKLIHPNITPPEYKEGLRVDLRVASVAVMDFDEKTKKWSVLREYDLETFEERFFFMVGEALLIKTGVAMELPKGYEAELSIRSSAFKKTSLIMTNGVGIIDNAYCGDEDEWMLMCHACENGYLDFDQRISQFKVVKCMPELKFKVVESLGNKSRGGYGTTGDK